MSEKITKVKGKHQLTIGDKHVSNSFEVPIIKVDLKTGEVVKEGNK